MRGPVVGIVLSLVTFLFALPPAFAQEAAAGPRAAEPARAGPEPRLRANKRAASPSPRRQYEKGKDNTSRARIRGLGMEVSFGNPGVRHGRTDTPLA